jgi:hypothetical protein
MLMLSKDNEFCKYCCSVVFSGTVVCYVVACFLHRHYRLLLQLLPSIAAAKQQDEALVSSVASLFSSTQ